MSWINDHIRTVPDFPLKGIMFRDMTTLFQNVEAFKRMSDELISHYDGRQFDKVVGIEARGFVLGGLMAYKMNAGFVPIRKAEKLPYETRTQAYRKEYGTDFLELHIDGVSAGERVLLVDDLIATGGTAEAAISLIRACGAVVEDACFIVDLPDLGGADLVRKLGCNLVALTQFGDD
jgi:adenine phosphoribosyltransferase